MRLRFVLAAALISTALLRAEDGSSAWLRYEPIYDPPNDPSVLELYRELPATVVRLNNSPAGQAAEGEILRGVRGMLGRTLRTATAPVDEDAIVLATTEELKLALPTVMVSNDLGANDGFLLRSSAANGHKVLVITSGTERGILYGAFAFLRHLQLHERVDHLEEQDAPYAPVRWTNEWDNLDGSIERGYGGRSIFFDNGSVVPDLTRASEYARLLASIGINGCVVNNVNANPRVLSAEFIPQLVRIADAFRPWGVRLAISVPFAAPKTSGGLDTFDPVDPRVAAWWKAKADELYRAIPDLGGFLVKADSEGQAGPSTYGRTHADAANVLAEALKPHGGILVYRGFVYNHHLDWRDLKNDRAKAAYENFHDLDGKFAENAIVQIKYGPIDFQAREPASPLIGALRHTNEVLELQITQEYTGQQRHLCYLVPMWKHMLDFDYRVDGASTLMKDVVSGRAFHRPLGGMVGVSDVGLDSNWMGYDLAQANLYGFGRLAWNPDLSARQITEEWTRMTWGNDDRVVSTIMNLELESWHVYEGYTGPLGVGTLTDILRSHYGPGIESAERNGWGQWIRADHEGIGMDRTVATGTGYIGQYSPEIARRYESLATCPDDLLLFMHHVPYTHVLDSGETVIQYVYDSHYDAAAEAEEFPEWWKTLRGRVDEQRFEAVLRKLEYQAGHAMEWRDAICQWFERISGIPDKGGRVGHDAGRTEAEGMLLNGYQIVDVTPWETASAGKAISCPASSCSAELTFKGAPGWYHIGVQYFDVSTGTARFELFVNSQLVKRWTANASLPFKAVNGDTSTRETVDGVALRSGDKIRLVGYPDGGNAAAVDYIEIRPE